MSQQSRLIVFGAAAFIILAVVLGVIIFMVRNSQIRIDTPPDTSTDITSRLPVISSTPSASVVTPPVGMKVFEGDGFRLNYPAEWGVLTCANSQNFELDPTNGTDVKNVVCDEALKPVTVLVADNLTCPGEEVALGSQKAVRSIAKSEGQTSYRWCVQADSKALDITHRVSPSGSRATSKDDFSKDIEKMIMAIPSRGSGGS